MQSTLSSPSIHQLSSSLHLTAPCAPSCLLLPFLALLLQTLLQKGDFILFLNLAMLGFFSPITTEELVEENDLLRDDYTTAAETGLPRGNTVNWRSHELWTTVTTEYNTRAQQRGIQQCTMEGLIQFGKLLRYCSCTSGQTCCCMIPEFPTIDGPGEPSSRVSLGVSFGSVRNSRLEAAGDDILGIVTNELLHPRKAGKFSWSILGEYLEAWEKELHTRLVYGRSFLNGSDQEKIKLTKMVYDKHQ